MKLQINVSLSTAAAIFLEQNISAFATLAFKQFKHKQSSFVSSSAFRGERERGV